MASPQTENRLTSEGNSETPLAKPPPQKRNHPIPVSNGIFDHREKVGSAIWLFLLLIDWTTEEKNGVGLVLGGKPITTAKLKTALRLEERQVRAQLQRLQSITFIRLRRAPYGFIIEVLKSKKFIFRDRQKVAALPLPDRQEIADQGHEIGSFPPLRSAESCRSNKDNTEETKKRVRDKPSPSNGSDPRIKEFFTWWDREYRKRFSERYHFTGGKEGPLIKGLLHDYNLPKLCDWALRFLDTKDSWVRENGGFTIGVFASQINKLVSTAKAASAQLPRPEMPL